MKHYRLSRSRQYWIHKIEERLGYFPLSCLHILIITLAFYAWMLSSLVSVEILIDCGTYKYFIWKTLDLHLIKAAVWFRPSAAFSLCSFFSILCRPKCNKNLKWAVTAIFKLVVMFICNTTAFIRIFGWQSWLENRGRAANHKWQYGRFSDSLNRFLNCIGYFRKEMTSICDVQLCYAKGLKQSVIYCK